jgi:ribulose-phosphate 3-epimerase
MDRKLRQLLAQEDKRSPLTDQQLAEKLGVRREEITLLRNQLGIPDSRERRREMLTADAADILSKEPDISARALTDRLQALGYEVSRYVAGQLLRELAENDSESGMASLSEPEAFSNLIGWDGSLRTQIQQAKAAVIYPPNGLHTLILGESGTGKSELAEAMYRYSLESGQRTESTPFIVFNCADYAENPQLLISQLFGHIRGAYTGANEDKEGLVEKANGGFLFLDEIHRLPPEGQEILYSIIDKGSYRRLGESDYQRKANLMLIAATTEDPESSLLVPFRRRIPMVIEMPPLRSRPLTERLEIILHFFRQEATRVGKKLMVRRDVLRALMSGDMPGNVGQIKSDIQVACARGFLNHFGSHSADEIEVSLNELSSSSRRGLLGSNNRQELAEFLPGDEVFYPNNGEQKAHYFKDNFYSVPDEIYTRIEELVEEGRRQGLPPDEASKWVSQQIEEILSSIIKRNKNLKADLTKFDLEKVIGSEWLIPRLAKCGADMISVHYEACPYPRRTLGMIKKYGLKAGLAFNPKTPVPNLDYFKPHLDYVIILTTEPELGDCPLLPDVLDKVRYGKQENDPKLLWFVDGGVTPDNIGLVAQCGADVVVSGRGVFSGGKIRENISRLKQGI